MKGNIGEITKNERIQEGNWVVMDITVSHLNNRLALQLPTELPLGLVFVVGVVENLRRVVPQSEGPTTELELVLFDLLEAGHRLRCRLSERTAVEVVVHEGDKIRAGGHLAFDLHQADYYLLARDVAIIEEPPIEPEEATPESQPILIDKPTHPKTVGRTALTPVLADIKRRALVSKLAEAKLPEWVQHIAPLEVQEQLKLKKKPIKDEAETAVLNKRLITVLSDAMDSQGDVELTPEMLDALSPVMLSPDEKAVVNDPYTVPPPETTPQSTEPLIDHSENQIDWLMIFLLLAILVLIIAVIFISATIWNV